MQLGSMFISNAFCLRSQKYLKTVVGASGVCHEMG
jgi:hypothetical protein